MKKKYLVSWSELIVHAAETHGRVDARCIQRRNETTDMQAFSIQVRGSFLLRTTKRYKLHHWLCRCITGHSAVQLR